MTLKELLLEELHTTPEPVLGQVLDFLRFLKTKQEQNNLTETLPPRDIPSQASNYPLQGKQPYQYDDPFAPAVPLEDWDVMQ
jgi:hypothetical protein